MYGIRKKQSKYRDVINQDVVILDDIFSQLLVMNANEDGIIYDDLMTYVKGDSPKMGKCWNGATALYFPYYLFDMLDTDVAEKERGKHWVLVKADLITAELVVFLLQLEIHRKSKARQIYGACAEDDSVSASKIWIFWPPRSFTMAL